MHLFMKVVGNPVQELTVYQKKLAEPERLSEVFGLALRVLHEVDASDCPINR
jgi:aminoglycoside phosphotransferase